MYLKVIKIIFIKIKLFLKIFGVLGTYISIRLSFGTDFWTTPERDMSYTLLQDLKKAPQGVAHAKRLVTGFLTGLTPGKLRREASQKKS